MSDLSIPVAAPARFAPLGALAFGATGAAAVAVTPATPLPVRLHAPATTAPLAGTTDVSGSFGPFVADPGAVWVTLSGEWSGRVRVLRAPDAAATPRPLTAGGAAWGSFTAAANEPVMVEGDAGARYHLAVELTAGTLAYRVAQ